MSDLVMFILSPRFIKLSVETWVRDMKDVTFYQKVQDGDGNYGLARA